MHKKVRVVIWSLAFFFLMLTGIGCGESKRQEEKVKTTEVETDSEIVEGIQLDESKLRVGGSISEAYVDPDSVPKVAPEDVKAKGYEYDYDSLTYELVWSDEFDYEGLPNEEKWDYDLGGNGWGNNELQYYTKGENVSVADGFLKIEARKEDYQNCEYTSTRLVSRGKGDWLYGKFEIYAKLPEGKGTWPAIWMLPTDWIYGDWPASGEIDIMEHVGYDQNRVHGSVHTQSYYHSIGTQKSSSVMVEGISDDFHLYTLEWLPDMIIISVDQEEYFRFKPTDFKQTPTYEQWPFDKRFHLLLNIAVGGNWGGAMGVDETIYPQELLVDYVRVYQSPEIEEIIKK